MTIRSVAVRTALTTAAAAMTLLTAAPAAHATSTPASADIVAWQRSGRPDRLLVVRPGTIGLLDHGSVVRRLYPAFGPLQLSWLAANAGPGWVSYQSGKTRSVRMATAVLLTPGTTLKIGSATGPVHMAAGRTAASGTWITGSHATLDIDDATLTSVAANGTVPAAPDTAGRPYLAMGSGGTMTIRNTTVTGFGRPGSAPARESGVTWGKDSTGSATGSTFRAGRTGLRLTGSTGVTLNTVTAEGSTEDGVVLGGDSDTVVHALTAEANGRNGVVVGGTHHRTLTGVTTRDNQVAGVRAAALRGLTLDGAASHGDRHSGIRLLSCAACAVTKPVVDGAPVGIDVSGAGSRVTVAEPALTGSRGRSGITLAAGIAGATVSGGRVSGFDHGIAVAASHVAVSGTTVSDAGTGVVIYGKASQVALHAVRISGGRVGVTASGTTSGVTLAGVRISGASGKGLSSASPDLRVTGGSVSGSTTAVDLEARSSLDRLSVSGARRGVHLAAGVQASGDSLDVLALRKGVEADSGARMVLTDSRVRAPIALDGEGSVRRDASTTITLPPFPWLGAAALAAITLAVVLQSIHQVRHRGAPRPRVAAHVRNTA
jgi:hypothetical protein